MGIWSKRSAEVLRRESLQQAPAASPSLRRSLGPWSLTAFGIGAIVGAGIFVVTGTAAAEYAGPGIVVSFLLAAFACGCAALCYAELAAMVPVSGGAYSYAYMALGELPAWVLGWTLICEFLFAAATISVGWSAYLASLLSMAGIHTGGALWRAPIALDATRTLHFTGAMANLPAALMALAMGAVLMRGARASARINNVIVAIKLAAILAFIAFGAFHVKPANWTPFIPPNLGQFGRYGWSGVFRAAGVIFFAFLGFDAVSTAAREARNPDRDTPMGIIASLLVCTILYVAVGLVLTGLSPYHHLAVADPLVAALQGGGPSLAFLRPLIGMGALIGLTSVMLVLLFAQSRIFHAMSRDGLLPAVFARVHPTAAVPRTGIAVAALATSTLGALFPIELLSELISIGTLFAFVVVCASVILLRRTQPSLPRPFRVPYAPIIGGVGAVTCGYLMFSLPVDTWLRFLGWTLAGLVLYCLYGSRRSVAAGAASADGRIDEPL